MSDICSNVCFNKTALSLYNESNTEAKCVKIKTFLSSHTENRLTDNSAKYIENNECWPIIMAREDNQKYFPA